jgi:hypothetical protein
MFISVYRRISRYGYGDFRGKVEMIERKKREDD